MARQTKFIQFAPSTQYATLFYDKDGSIGMAILEEPVDEEISPIRDRCRPTGEVGSGPYFNAYYAPENGVLSHYEGNYRLTDNADYDEVVRDASMTAPNWVLRHCSKSEMWACSAWFSGQPGLINTHMYYMRITGWSIYHGFWGVYDEVDGVEAYKDLHTDSISEAKALFNAFLRECKAKPVRHWRPFMVPALSDYTYVRDFTATSIPYKLGERTCLDYYLAFDEIFVGRYRALQDQAYINAAENLPAAATNSIANVLEWASTFKNLASGKIDSIGKIKDIWLGYRYSYSTTKLDIQEYAAFTSRLAALANMPLFTIYGEAERDGIRCIAQFDLDTAQFIPDDAKSFLKAYGFKLNAVNAWDMIPYSFVVDWFLHVGDILQKFEDADMMYQLTPLNFWNTFVTRYNGVKCYFRVPGEWRYAIPWLTFGGTSNKTIGKRITDSLALFLA